MADPKEQTPIYSVSKHDRTNLSGYGYDVPCGGCNADDRMYCTCEPVSKKSELSKEVTTIKKNTRYEPNFDNSFYLSKYDRTNHAGYGYDVPCRNCGGDDINHCTCTP